MLAIPPVCSARFPNCTMTFVESYFDDQDHVTALKMVLQCTTVKWRLVTRPPTARQKRDPAF